jgi:hypothetical protein
MPKYNYKADALTDFFKGKLSAKELDKIARNDFGSGVATKKELSNFLSNKFTQDVMSDTYGIPAGTLVKRVRDLMKFAESVNEDKFYNTRVQYTDPKSKKKFVGDVVRKDGDEYKVNLGKDGRFEKYILAKAKDLKIVSKSKKRTYEAIGKPTISKPFKSNDRTFDKVYDTFDKKDYFNSKGLAKVQIGNFERALKKNDKGAQQVLDMFKGDEKKAKDYITQVISDRNKERAFNNYKALKSAVDSIQKGKPNVGAVDYVKRIIHNSSQKYSIALYSTLRNKKFTKWKDVHDDIDSLVSESVNEGKKRYYQQDRVGSAKYTISYHDGKKKHKDGSDFFDIQTFKNKKDLAKFVNTLHKGGYVYGFNESVNEATKGDVMRAVKGRPNPYTLVVIKRGDVIYQKNIKNPQEVPAVYSVIRKHMDKGERIHIEDRTGKIVFKEGLNEAYIVLYAPKKGVKPVTTAAYKDKKDAEKWAKDLGGITMIVKKKVKGIDETKAEINKIKKQAGKKEIKFYDILSNLEKKLGKKKYRDFLVKSLKDFKINGNHYDYRTNAAAEEKLFQVSEINTNEDLRNWFKSKWVNIGKKDKSGKHPPCGTSGKKRGYAKCVPAAKAASMSKKEKESATRRKRAAQNKSNRGGKSSAGQGKKPINVSTHTGGRKSGTGKGS